MRCSADIYDEFVQAATEVAKAVKTGDPFDQTTQLGPIVSQIQFDKAGSPLPSPSTSPNDKFQVPLAAPPSRNPQCTELL